MRTAIPSIIKQISKTTIAAGLALSLFGGAAAVAGEPTAQQRAEAAMMQGKDYAAAWADASRAEGPTSSPDLAARIIRSEKLMNEGKDYVAARDAISQPESQVFAPEQIAKAQRAEEAMSQGKDYVAAWQASDKEQPATISASRAGGATMAGRARTKE